MFARYFFLFSSLPPSISFSPISRANFATTRLDTHGASLFRKFRITWDDDDDDTCMSRTARSCGRWVKDAVASEGPPNVLANVNYVSRIRGHMVSIYEIDFSTNGPRKVFCTFKLSSSLLHLPHFADVFIFCIQV